MKVPNANAAEVGRKKLQGYLLSLTHPAGSAKARFFRNLGFAESNVTLLEQALKAIVLTEQVVDLRRSPHGVKYVVNGWLPTPSGSRVWLRTVWIIETGQVSPRLVTAYPV